MTDDEMHALLADLDFDVAVPCCATPANPCRRRATYYARCRVCQNPAPRCDAHLFSLRLLASGPTPLRCPFCNHVGRTLEELVSIEPVEVRS